MELSDRQIQELKNKIEKYRTAIESLDASGREESSQLRDRIGTLEAQYAELRIHQTKLVEQMNDIKNSMNSLQHANEVTANEGRLNPKRTSQQGHRNPTAIPTFNRLKKWADEKPLLYASSTTPSHEEGSPARMVNKPQPDNSFTSIDGSPIDPPVVENKATQSNEETKKQDFTMNKETLESTGIIQPERVKEEPRKASNRASTFWKGILKI